MKFITTIDVNSVCGYNDNFYRSNLCEQRMVRGDPCNGIVDIMCDDSNCVQIHVMQCQEREIVDECIEK